MMELEFAPNDAQAGFRLHRLEVYNWGTFDSEVWRLHPNGQNTLVTGEIGSGKSTLVDAISTLLVPAQRITFNKAAGAEARERSLRSYVSGYYKSEQSTTGAAARPVSLRDEHSYSVVLAGFYNRGFEQRVTIAQVFWYKDQKGGQPARMYVISQDDLHIESDFSNFGSDISKLRKRLKSSGAHVSDTFPPYGKELKRRLGIRSDQALELFNQTVSMKSVGNLTDFVRAHMLEPFAAADRVEALIQHFDDLTRAHDQVQKAREQLAMLEPLTADGHVYEGLVAEARSLERQQQALPFWLAHLQVELLETELAKDRQALLAKEQSIERISARKRDLHERRDEIKAAIFQNGGDRVEQLKAEIARRQRACEKAKSQFDVFTNICHQLGFAVAGDEVRFAASRAQALTDLKAAADEEAAVQNRLTDAAVAFRDNKDNRDEITGELDSLRARQTNIPRELLSLRNRIADAVQLAPEDLPFAGELIKVHDDERHWEGAIERLLHGFALALLVGDTSYGEVARWVNRNHLNQLLVYYRVRGATGRLKTTDPASLARKLEVKHDAEHAQWLQYELSRKFDHACVESIDEFRRHDRALTREGQVKEGQGRHRKDDRSRIDDRGRYVLGWNNLEKIQVLEQRKLQTEQKCLEAAEAIATLQNTQHSLRQRQKNLDRLINFTSFADIDWGSIAQDIENLGQQLAELERDSDQLRALRGQLKKTDEALGAVDAEYNQEFGEKSRIEQRLETTEANLAGCRARAAQTTPESRQEFESLEARSRGVAGGVAPSLEQLPTHQDTLRTSIAAELERKNRGAAKLRDSVVGAMKDYNHRWPLETREVNAAIESLEEYRGIVDAIRSDDLPRFEQRFKKLLNENTIREVANFQAQLEKERRTIQDRIDVINKSLRQIEYNEGRYIVLLADRNAEQEIAAFRQDLRACTEGALTGSTDDKYTETKFLQVKDIVERFKGREGFSDIDRRWTSKVTDVRQWFEFSASERFDEDDQPFEHYADSSGKSGGQKEKLAYTVLAASLAYQFGLEMGEKSSRSFRFVVIDEAFGRGSDDSARFGLELFDRLNLQLLVVTPLQKIHIIESYVSTVGYVHNRDSRSMLRNLTLEEYQEEKRARAGLAT